MRAGKRTLAKAEGRTDREAWIWKVRWGVAVWRLLTRAYWSFRLLLSLAVYPGSREKTILLFVVDANISKSHRTSAAWLTCLKGIRNYTRWRNNSRKQAAGKAQSAEIKKCCENGKK